MFVTANTLTDKPIADFASGFTFVPSWDLLIFIVFLGAIFLYGLTLGKDRLIMLLLSVYFSIILVSSIPWEAASKFLGNGQAPSPSLEAFIFFAVIVALSFLMPRSILGSKIRVGRAKGGSIFYVIVFSLCSAGILTATTLSLLSVEIVSDLNPLLIQLFGGAEARFFWLLAPILLLVLLRPGKGDI